MFFPYWESMKGHAIPPAFTQVLGPVFVGNKISSHQTYEMITMLANRLSRLKSIVFQAPTSFVDWSPFYWAGYRETTRYTYILDVDPSEPEAMRHAANTTLRRKLAAATKEGLAVSSGTADELVALTTLSVERSGETLRNKGKLKELVLEAMSQGWGEVYVSRLPNGEAAAAVFLVADAHTLYYIAGGQDLEKSKNAHAQVLFTALDAERQQRKLSRIDFEGSMLRGVAYYFAGFGAKPKPYHRISRGRISSFDRLKRFLINSRK